MNALYTYAGSIVEKAGKKFASGEVFAKVLSPNDDASRHGVLVPTDAYSFFPYFEILNVEKNATLEFPASDTLKSSSVTLAYKYYERYPERRITRLNGVINDLGSQWRLVVFLRARHADGTSGYYVDFATSSAGGRFDELYGLLFGSDIECVHGAFVLRPVDSNVFEPDEALNDLLQKFDDVKKRGWIDSMRAGDTGIGYTFETLLGIKENNDQAADFRGIEIKCKAVKEGASSHGGKINLFQLGPDWLGNLKNKELIRVLGQPSADGLYTCYSQVTTTANNLGLSLRIAAPAEEVDLLKNTEKLGFWPYMKLQKRLAEKHSRAAFVKAERRAGKGAVQFSYRELVYCERPTLGRFVELLEHRNIVFEFTLSEKEGGAVRNHGYPWRLVREEFLEHLFAYKVQLRS